MSLVSGAGTATFNFGGGTLRAGGALSIRLPMTLTGTGGNANIDTAGYPVTLFGTLSGVGGLNKLGTSGLALAAANTYTGNTNVSAGTLTLTGTGSLLLDINDSENSFITVAPGAKLDLLGTLKLDITGVTASSENWLLVDNDGTTVYEPSFALKTSFGVPFTQLNDVWSYSLGSRNWTFTEATGILSLTTVPEPSAFALLGIAVCSLLAYARRWRKRRA